MQAGRGTVVCRRKSLELIRKEVCCLFRAETASRQDSAERLKPCNRERKRKQKEKKERETKMFPLLNEDGRTRNNQKLAEAENKMSC